MTVMHLPKTTGGFALPHSPPRHSRRALLRHRRQRCMVLLVVACVLVVMLLFVSLHLPSVDSLLPRGKQPSIRVALATLRADPTWQQLLDPDSAVRQLSDQISLGKAYLTRARDAGRGTLATRWKRGVRAAEAFLARSIAIPSQAVYKLEARAHIANMSALILQAKEMHYDIAAAMAALKEKVAKAEEKASKASAQATLASQVVSESMPKPMTCLYMRLAREWALLHSSAAHGRMDDDALPFQIHHGLELKSAPHRSLSPPVSQPVGMPNSSRLVDTSLQHLCIFSDNVLAVSAALNSTVLSSHDPSRLVFHIVTDATTFPAFMHAGLGVSAALNSTVLSSYNPFRLRFHVVTDAASFPAFVVRREHHQDVRSLMGVVLPPPTRLGITRGAAGGGESGWLNASFAPVLRQMQDAGAKSFYFSAAAADDVPRGEGKRLLSLDMGRVMAGAKERGELELRVTSLVAEAVAAAGEVILVIDEVHTMVGAGAVGRGRDGGGSGLDISNLLKPALSRGQIQCIVTTTSEFSKHLEKDKALAQRLCIATTTTCEFRKHLEKDKALAQRLVLTALRLYPTLPFSSPHNISASPPPPPVSSASTLRRTRHWPGAFTGDGGGTFRDGALLAGATLSPQIIPIAPLWPILYHLRHLYKAHHKCVLSDSALAAAVTLSARFIPDHRLPDKEIDQIDAAASRSRVEGSEGRRAGDSQYHPLCIPSLPSLPASPLSGSRLGNPTREAALEILHGLRHLYEAHHKCVLSDSALAAAVTLSARFIPDRCLPDKAIDLIDEAASRSRVEGSKGRRRRASGVLERGAEEYWREIRMAQAAHEAAHARQNPFTSLTSFLSHDNHTHVADTTTAAVSHFPFSSPTCSISLPPCRPCAPEPLHLTHLLPLARQSRPRCDTTTAADAAAAAGRSRSGITGRSDKDDSPTHITAEHIAAVAAHWTGIPLQQLSLSDQQHLAGLEEALETRVVGQGQAVRVIARAVQRARVGLKGEGRPVAALLFSGPTGKLIGAPPGYVGYGEGGKLTEAVRRRPFCLILLDEIEKAHPDIEKAHPDVFNLLLQIFEDGRLTDSQVGGPLREAAPTASASSRQGIMRLLMGMGERWRERGAGGCGAICGDERGGDGELKAHFRPELMNRSDEVVVFRVLEKEQLMNRIDEVVVFRALERGAGEHV
ncbi:unnamed protein product [Closterium sp. Naga37s-1]|nr:unnamed protein product [Closterium sp. Naga37s-1]